MDETRKCSMCKVGKFVGPSWCENCINDRTGEEYITGNHFHYQCTVCGYITKTTLEEINIPRGISYTVHD
jgi:hypothetical protein